jgi:hypothetical protein
MPRPATPLRHHLSLLADTHDPAATEQLLSALLALDPSRRVPAAACSHLGLLTAEPVLVPLRYTRHRDSGKVGVLVEASVGRTMEDLLASVLHPARRRWETMHT